MAEVNQEVIAAMRSPESFRVASRDVIGDVRAMVIDAARDVIAIPSKEARAAKLASMPPHLRAMCGEYIRMVWQADVVFVTDCDAQGEAEARSMEGEIRRAPSMNMLAAVRKRKAP